MYIHCCVHSKGFVCHCIYIYVNIHAYTLLCTHQGPCLSLCSRALFITVYKQRPCLSLYSQIHKNICIYIVVYTTRALFVTIWENAGLFCENIGLFSEHIQWYSDIVVYTTRALIVTVSLYMLAKEPYILAKEPCILPKEPYILAKEPVIQYLRHTQEGLIYNRYSKNRYANNTNSKMTIVEGFERWLIWLVTFCPAYILPKEPLHILKRAL